MQAIKKFTKKAFRAALKANDQTRVWYLSAIKFGRTPTRKEVQDLIEEVADTIRDNKKAHFMAFQSQRWEKIFAAETNAWIARGGYRQYGIHHYRSVALEMLRRLATEQVTSYTKVPMFGTTHLYFCSPTYGHKDYNKVRTCRLNSELTYDPASKCHVDTQAAWCKKIVELGERIYARKAG